MAEQVAIRIGISFCLLGEQVRYDGGHKRDSYLTEVLRRFVRFVPVCPEVEIGLGIPRESIHLVKTENGIRLQGVTSRSDHTEAMTKFANSKISDLQNLHAFIFKKDSPSCGMDRVRVYADGRLLHKQGRGLFASIVIEQFPLLPVEEEGRLNDLSIRENFVERIFCYYRWTEFLNSSPTLAKLVEFHTRHKMTLLAHSPEIYRRLGRIVAQCAGSSEPHSIFADYGKLFMRALQHKATRSKHSNCLYHLMGHLKNVMDHDDRQELVNSIEEYRKELIPLIVPITLLRHHFRRNAAEWVMKQTYLNPHPSELLLRNHV